ncbi:hypothetical protein [Streptomyces sp. NPDC050759]|uniref:hypothetical protein n=1 Tax=Streptomyces sp. NPDC050759 TaxID=3365635 RepID=UPI0037883972
MDAEKRLRLAAESLHREALGFDADAFTDDVLRRLGIKPSDEGCAGDSALRTGHTPVAGPERGGRRRKSDAPVARHTEFFELELEELRSNTTSHTEPRVLRRIAELTELLHGGGAARDWWIQAANSGDELAVLTTAEWTGGQGGEQADSPPAGAPQPRGGEPQRYTHDL